VKNLGALDDLGRPRESSQQEIGWACFHHDSFASYIAKNNS
jgi:hypothetical protein